MTQSLFVRGYRVIIHKDPASDFGVTFPAFPGCVTAGRTVQEALEMAEQALAGHIEAMQAARLAIPAPIK